MTRIYDFNANKINYAKAGTYGGNAGNKDAVFWNDGTWIIKYPKTTKSMDVQNLSYTTAPLSEYIGSHIYDILGFDVHLTELGFRNEKIVVACKDFCKEGEILKEIRTIKNLAGKNLAEEIEETAGDLSDLNKVNLNELLLHLKHNEILSVVPGVKKRFWDMVVVDVFINNNDRNNGNWGLIYADGQHRLAPVFDNGASFSNKLSDEKILSFLGNEEILKTSALSGRTVFVYNDKELSAKKILEFDSKELKASLNMIVPVIEEKFSEIETFINEIPNEYEGLYVCSEERKKFYIEGMKIRLKKMLLPLV